MPGPKHHFNRKDKTNRDASSSHALALPPHKIFTYGSIIILLFYLIIFSDSGIIIRQQLEQQRKNLQNLKNSLTKEQKKLKKKFNLLQDDNLALQLEGKKYFLLNDKAQVLRFIEQEDANRKTNGEKSNSSELPKGGKYAEIDIKPINPQINAHGMDLDSNGSLPNGLNNEKEKFLISNLFSVKPENLIIYRVLFISLSILILILLFYFYRYKYSDI
jgi:hypothetical protein